MTGVLTVLDCKGTIIECTLKTKENSKTDTIEVSIDLFYKQGQYTPQDGNTYEVKCENGEVTEIITDV